MKPAIKRPTLAQDLAEIMKSWNKIEADAKRQFPNASKEEIFKLTSGAMNHALGINQP